VLDRERILAKHDKRDGYVGELRRIVPSTLMFRVAGSAEGSGPLGPVDRKPVGILDVYRGRVGKHPLYPR